MKRAVLFRELESTGKKLHFSVSLSEVIVAASKISPLWAEIIRDLPVE